MHFTHIDQKTYSRTLRLSSLLECLGKLRCTVDVRVVVSVGEARWSHVKREKMQVFHLQKAILQSIKGHEGYQVKYSKTFLHLCHNKEKENFKCKFIC